jgi:hypothetical protein
MEDTTRNVAPILEVAWQRYAQLNAAASGFARQHYRTRSWILVLGVLVTLFAILADGVNLLNRLSPLLGLVIKVLSIITPFLVTVLTVFSFLGQANTDRLVTSAGAQEILKEIYLYRTVMKKESNRHQYLGRRLADIQRRISRNLRGTFSFEDYTGRIPPYHDPGNPTSDPGFNDLTGEEYAKYRLKDQLAWHNRKINQLKKGRGVTLLLLLGAGGLGSILAALGGPLSIWVALLGSVILASSSSYELRNLDSTMASYSKVVTELSLLYEYWQNLEPEERTGREIEKMVLGCERILWSENKEAIQTMQEALREADLEKDAAFINEIIKDSADSAERGRHRMQENIIEDTTQFPEEDQLDSSA